MAKAMRQHAYGYCYMAKMKQFVSDVISGLQTNQKEIILGGPAQTRWAP